MNDETKEWLSATEAAALYGVGYRRFLKELRHEGVPVRHTTATGRFLIHRDTLAALIEKNTRPL